jgi:hypothetical protein
MSELKSTKEEDIENVEVKKQKLEPEVVSKMEINQSNDSKELPKEEKRTVEFEKIEDLLKWNFKNQNYKMNIVYVESKWCARCKILIGNVQKAAEILLSSGFINKETCKFWKVMITDQDESIISSHPWSEVKEFPTIIFFSSDDDSMENQTIEIVSGTKLLSDFCSTFSNIQKRNLERKSNLKRTLDESDNNK